ncbi:hypothetical protein INT47_002723 [Mucor saturninus]|uniref:Uncharacterized protein n=1 Tax=Mucor saturninus TaxID=64648 RepID=A0A8H7QMS8_9FUNG|nr:hypothetical protein INT47_002723 [Mucor saturninus]
MVVAEGLKPVEEVEVEVVAAAVVVGFAPEQHFCFGGRGGNVLFIGALSVVATVESLSDLLLNNLIFSDTRPIAGEVGEDIFDSLQ